MRAAILRQRRQRRVQSVPAAGHRLPIGRLHGAPDEPHSACAAARDTGARAAPNAHAQLARAEMPSTVRHFTA